MASYYGHASIGFASRWDGDIHDGGESGQDTLMEGAAGATEHSQQLIEVWTELATRGYKGSVEDLLNAFEALDGLFEQFWRFVSFVRWTTPGGGGQWPNSPDACWFGKIVMHLPLDTSMPCI